MMKGALLAAIMAIVAVDSSLGFATSGFLPALRFRAGRSSLHAPDGSVSAQPAAGQKGRILPGTEGVDRVYRQRRRVHPQIHERVRPE
eukprot:84256-Rhodomonas_salina.1